jgi:hypothetical protein
VVPFVHTAESWAAALSYLQGDIAVRHLHQLTRLMTAPPNPNARLTGDFTYSGRNGIANMGSTCYVNALLQVLNVLEHYSLKLIAQPTEGLEPFVQQFRDVLANLRFVRGRTVSVDRLAETIPNFNACVQQDAGEFLTMLVNQVHDKLDQKVAADITNHLRGRLTTHIRTDSVRFASTPEDFFYLSLRTKGMTRLDEAFIAYFEEETMEDGYNGVFPAFRHCEVVEWPDYLVLQLERWDFALETGSRTKLTHEFDFPVTFRTSQFQRGDPADVVYSLVGVVVHEGTADEGHYVSIVQSNDCEWYICNDTKIEYFDLNSLPAWAFGIREGGVADEDVSTAYLLFYTRAGMDRAIQNIPRDLEAELNLKNQETWPQVIFYSEPFVRHVQKVLADHPKNKEALELGLAVFLRIAVVDEPGLDLWRELFTKRSLGTKERCQLLIDFVATSIGTDLPAVVAVSDAASNAVLVIFQHALEKLDAARPFLTILKCMNIAHPRTKALPVVFALIADACRDLHLDWSREDELLRLVVEWLAVGVPKDAPRTLAKTHLHAFNAVMSLMIAVVGTRGVTRAVAEALAVENLNRLVSFGKKTDSFPRMIAAVATARPDFFHNITEARSALRSALSLIVPSVTLAEPDEEVDYDLTHLWPSLSALLFCARPLLRRDAAFGVRRLLGKRDPAVVQVSRGGIREGVPAFDGEKNSIHLFVGQLAPRMLDHLADGEEDRCYEYITLVYEIAFIAPGVLIPYFPVFLQALTGVASREAALLLLETVYTLIAVHPVLKKQLTEEYLQRILDSPFGSPIAVRFIDGFREEAQGSPLAGSCVEYYFVEEFDEDGKLLLQMIADGLVPGGAPVPEVADDLSKLMFANALWDKLEEIRPQLATFMLSALKLAVPFGLFSQAEMVAKAYALLEDYAPAKLTEVRQYIKEREAQND